MGADQPGAEPVFFDFAVWALMPHAASNTEWAPVMEGDGRG